MTQTSENNENELDILLNSMAEPAVEDELEQEFQETQQGNKRTSEVPAKFAGKSAEEISEAYVNLEKELGRKNQEVGELRKLTDQYLHQELTKKEAPVTQDDDIEFDELVDNPKEAVSKLVDPKIKQLEQQLATMTMERKKAEFVAKHGDPVEIASNADFQEWVNSSRYRQKMFAIADQEMDFDIADELLTEWNALQQAREAQKTSKTQQKRAAKLKDATVESVGSPAPSSKRIYRRSDLIKLRVNDPEKWEALSDEITLAYQEGRVK